MKIESSLALKTAVATVAAMAVAGLAVGCGGGSQSSRAAGEVVARVGSVAVTKAAVSRWMGILAAGDYLEMSAQHIIPAGLVSDPPNYGSCVTHIEAAAASSPKKVPTPSGPELLTKCRQLYQALRAQAAEYLVKVPWLAAAERELGITTTDAEVTQAVNQAHAAQFHGNQAAYQEYLSKGRLTPSDEFFLVKFDVMAKKLAAGGRRLYARFAAAGQRSTARTDCKPGYVVMYCRQYTASTPAIEPPPSVLMEQVAYLATGRCTNRPACLKQ